ncbi:hypothetical protein [Magnetospira thiophila]
MLRGVRVLLEIVLVVFFVTHRGRAFGSRFLGQGLSLLLLLLLLRIPTQSGH